MFFMKKSKPSGNIDFMIVGLGNIGSEYENTRHNAGFIVLDMLAERLGCDINKNKFSADYATVTVSGKRCLLLKPLTFMNNSGKAVGEAARFYKVPCENIIVVSDDISLDVGKLRIRRKGSDGGHNGLKSIIAAVGDGFARIKIGVGKKPHPDYDLAAWVLSRFKSEETAPLKEAAQKACDAVALMVEGKTDMAMNRFNS